jgi:L-serine deaminase
LDESSKGQSSLRALHIQNDLSIKGKLKANNMLLNINNVISDASIRGTLYSTSIVSKAKVVHKAKELNGTEFKFKVTLICNVRPH